jgi:predicted nucleic acid-binding protein|uniref:PIN domain-containing protein n=1 Tax=Prosthecobacter sp. TaxID=1965333 RepID=UPI003782F586
MIAFIETSALVAAIVGTEDYHRECDALMDSGELGMFAHGLAETFSILTSGRRKLQMTADAASELIEQDFLPLLSVTSLTPTEMMRAMRDAQSRGVRGGGIYDYLHLVAARKAKAARIYTLNLSNFRAIYRPGDPEIVHPGV